MYCSSDIAVRIKKLAKEKKILLKDMFEKTGLGRNTMANLKTSMPKADNLAKMADYLDCSVDYLLGRCDNPSVNRSGGIAAKPAGFTSSFLPQKLMPFYRTTTSAGNGSVLLDYTFVEYVNIDRTGAAASADFILEVRGDSMEPRFFDGDCVLIQRSARIHEGEIGIFIVNGDSYIKKIGNGKLLSLNPAYEPILLHEYDDIRCVGKVIGTIELD